MDRLHTSRRRVSWQGVCMTWIIVWIPPAGPVAQLPARATRVREPPESRSPSQSGALSHPVSRIGLQRMGAVFPLSPLAVLTSAQWMCLGGLAGTWKSPQERVRSAVCAQRRQGSGAHTLEMSGVLAEKGPPSL